MEKQAQSNKNFLIDNVLAADALHRYPGVAKGLVPLSELALKAWDYSHPTLEMENNRPNAYSEVKIRTTDEFVSHFYSQYWYLRDVPLDGLLIAGGAAGQFVLKKADTMLWKASDVDIFVYGQKSPEEATERVKRLIIDLDSAFFRQTLGITLGDLNKRLIELQRAEASLPVTGIGKAALLAATRILQRLLSKPDEIVLARTTSKGEEMDVIQRPPWATESEWAETVQTTQKYYFNVPFMKVDAVRSEGVLTITGAYGMNIQVIFRLYKTASEILHGFDLGPSAVGFDGKNVWFTGLSRFAYEYGLSIVDVTRRSPTYEQRLAKYMKRGFNLVLPSLDMAAIERSPAAKYGKAGILDLPHMPVMYQGVGKNRVTVVEHLRADGDRSSDYGPDGELDADETGNEFKTAFANLYRLLGGRKDFLHIVQDSPVIAVLDTFTKPPHLSVDIINSLYKRFRASVWKHGRLSVEVLRRYVPCADIKKVIDCSANADKMRVELDRVFEEQKSLAIKAWVAITGSQVGAVPWITENPGKQGGLLTGSRTPVATTAEEWYGPCLAK